MRQNNVYLLDCTLRDGGYVNDWTFGEKTIHEVAKGVARAGVEIVEIGFLRSQGHTPERSIFSRPEEISALLLPREQNTKFVAMIEAKQNREDQFPLQMLEKLRDCGLDFIRIMTWEWLMEKHMDYCMEAKARGLEISIQPTAIVDYNDDRFLQLLEKTNAIHPWAFYLVDTWGTESPAKIRHFAEMADKELDAGIKLGYHGHNNKMQALVCLEVLLSMPLSRDLCCDVSIGGMGKGPGNLQSEVAADYLNEREGKKYDVEGICNLYSRYIKQFKREESWGYSLYHFIGSQNHVTQNYATYFRKMDYGEEVFRQFVHSLKGREKVVFTSDFTENRLAELGLKSS